MKSNKQRAEHFLSLVEEGKIEEAFEVYVSKDFQHHNPHFKADAHSLMTAMMEDAKENPEKNLRILRSMEDGELVAVHSHMKQNPEDKGFILVHFFKFKERMIYELWDVGQEIPQENINELGMF